MKRFVDLADLSRDEVRNLLDLARRLETHPEPQALAGKILGLVFFNPSLRTLASLTSGDIDAVLLVGPSAPTTKRGLSGVRVVMASAACRAISADALFIS